MLLLVHIPGRLLFSEGKGMSTGSEEEEKRGCWEAEREGILWFKCIVEENKIDNR